MKIKTIEVFVFKFDHHYRLSGHTDAPNRLAGTDYYFEPQWRHAYSRFTESCIVKITTDTGIVGWGESQAPLVPEVPATLIASLLGPAVLGLDPTNTEYIYDRLYHLSHVRGHTTSYTIDAMAGLDIALWDIKAQVLKKPLYKLLGNRATNRLPLYVSGLRLANLPDRLRLAKEKISEGFQGVKIFIGDTVEKGMAECEAVRSAIGPKAFFALDAIGKYDYSTAYQIGHGLDQLNASWFESPLDPEDIANHAKLAGAIKTPIAMGEALRTVREFKPWFNQNAMRVAQPDIVRCGITGGQHIIQLARKNKLQIAPHLGVCTAIGVAATWHLSAVLSGVIQEHQLEMFETANTVLKKPLQVEKGQAVLPEGDGLGITTDKAFIESSSSEKWVISSKGIVHDILQRKTSH